LHERSVSPEVWTAILTLIAYQLGDALDKIVYRREPAKEAEQIASTPVG